MNLCDISIVNGSYIQTKSHHWGENHLFSKRNADGTLG